MSAPIQDQINLLKEQLAEYLQDIPPNENKISAIRNRIAELEAEAGQKEQEKAEREQAKDSAIDGFVDVLKDMYEALFPADRFRQEWGINEYEEKRAQFYQLNHAYFAEKVDEIHQQNEYILAQKDERIKLLNDQSLKVQEQLDAALNTIRGLREEAVAEADNYNDIIDELKDEKKQLADELRITKKAHEMTLNDNKYLAADYDKLKVENEELKDKLASAQQPKEVKPSGKLSDIMGQIKSKNEVAADEWLARFNARQKPEDKLEVPEITPPAPTESPFRSDSADNQTNAADDRIHTPEVDQVGATFPVVEAPTVPSLVNPMDQGQHSGEAPAHVTKAELEERLAQLKQEILTEVIGEGKVA